VKVVLDAPDGTETTEGTKTAMLLLARLTDMPVLPAGALNFTVQVSEPAAVINVFAQLSADSIGEVDPLPWSFTVPPRLPEVVVLAAMMLSWPVESVVDPG
jgi:hypothetical protein